MPNRPDSQDHPEKDAPLTPIIDDSKAETGREAEPASDTALAEIAQKARRAFVAQVTRRDDAGAWWTAVIVTASSSRQAERYESEIQRRRDAGKLPTSPLYLVVPDIDNQRIGSGGATLNALRVLGEQLLPGAREDSLKDWWSWQRVLLIHSGGDSRRLPEYSLAGKLFSALPIKTPWGDVSTVFDETLVLSTSWAEELPAGLVVASGDVILTFDSSKLGWDRPGVCGVAMLEPMKVASQHGVYVVGDAGRVYSFLQKPSAAEVAAAGGMFPGDQVALDIGLLRFDPAVAARLTELAGAQREEGRWVVGAGILGDDPRRRPIIDLYEHMTLALTGEWKPGPGAGHGWQAMSAALRDTPFWCSVVPGDFTHVGTTSHFLRLMSGDTRFSSLYTAQQRIGSISPPGVHSSGVVVDSVFAEGGEVAAGSVVIECHFDRWVRTGKNSSLHGLDRIPFPITVPNDTVAHQAPVRLEDGRRGVVIRVYGVGDDPKRKVTEAEATWFGRPLMSALVDLGLDPELVWPDTPIGERCLWNARLYACGSIETAWACASWLMGNSGNSFQDEWGAAERLSLADSARWADTAALAETRNRRYQASWRLTAVALAESGTDIRPMLARSPGVTALTQAGRTVEHQARELEDHEPTTAASRYFQASLFLGQAGLDEQAGQVRADAFRCVKQAVELGCQDDCVFQPREWRHQSVRVEGPARVDFGGGWSDTPPFCLDWGGTVLNVALSLNGVYPIATTVTRFDEPIVRCCSSASEEVVELRATGDIAAYLRPGSPIAIPLAGLRLLGIVEEEGSLAARLTQLGGGLEIRTEVDLPMGSGLGTSSILAATLLRALAEMAGIPMTELSLSDQVMRLEQLITTGGGWQDQAGGIFPGAKLVTTGPGLRQRLRVQQLVWTPEQQREFEDRFVLYYTGIRRIAKNLLAQVVGSYLAREVSTLQVLHSIKTLAFEMSYAMNEGEWDYLGALVNRHWQHNQILDSHTTNAPIDALLREIQPFISGAKLAGAGGGGFLIMIAKDPASANKLRNKLNGSRRELPGSLYNVAVSPDGLRVSRNS